MREIKLPTTNTVAFTIQASELSKSGILMPDGLRHVSAGQLGADEFAELEIARANAGKVLWSAICIEQKIDRVLINYFMGPFSEPSAKRSIFENEVLGNPSFNLGFKKGLLDIITQEITALSGDKRSKLQGRSKKVIKWRNAFAHGHLKLEAKRGVVLCYYAGGPQEQTLDDDFWSFLEGVYDECDKLVKELESETAKYDV